MEWNGRAIFTLRFTMGTKGWATWDSGTGDGKVEVKSGLIGRRVCVRSRAEGRESDC